MSGVLTLLEDWTSIDVTSSVLDTECAHCFDEESSCLHGPSTISWDLSSTDLLPRGHSSASGAGRRPMSGGLLCSRSLVYLKYQFEVFPSTYR